MISLATKDDTQEILNLYKAQIGQPFCAWNEHYPTEEEIKYDLSRDALFVMKNDENRIIAAISLDKDEAVEKLECWNSDLYPGGELSRLAVLKEYQNRGLARRMLAFGMQELKRRGYRSVHFLVAKSNTPALRSYEHLKCAKVGETEMFESSYWCFEKSLQDMTEED